MLVSLNNSRLPEIDLRNKGELSWSYNVVKCSLLERIVLADFNYHGSIYFTNEHVFYLFRVTHLTYVNMRQERKMVQLPTQ